MRSKRTPYLILLAVAALTLASAMTVASFWGDRRFINEPLHSADEALGAFAAVAMAAILLAQKRADDENKNKFLLPALGFLGMGMLDSFHSISGLEQGFVFLHSVASLVGGFFFVLIWLPRSAIDMIAVARRWLPWALIVISLLFFVAVQIAGDAVPMVREGRFTSAAVAINALAGLFFVAAAVRLMLDFSLSEEAESYFLAAVALLFGMAELTFTYSFVWSALWWFWHLLRLGAYVLVLGFIYITLARLNAEEHNIAATLQEALLKMPKKIAGLEFGYRYVSATEEAATVGGDFYDLFELGHGRVAVVIGDVSGKGLQAATMTSLVKNTIKAYAIQESSPAKVLAGTNAVVWRASLGEVFVTVFLAVLDYRTGSLVYCGAGHPPPILKKRAGGTSCLSTACAAVGIFPELDYVDITAKLEKGDVLIAYTDGVIEARRNKEFFGQDRLLALVDNLEPGTATRRIPKIILDEVASFTGRRFRDDIAVLAVSLAP